MCLFFTSFEELFGCLCIAAGEALQAAGGAEIVSSGAQTAWGTAMQPKLYSCLSHPGQSGLSEMLMGLWFCPVVSHVSGLVAILC